jgi:high-affinity K+ transport system ATPase subunit B
MTAARRPSVANDIAKYFAILPDVLGLYAATPGGKGPLGALDIMHLHSPQSAIPAGHLNALIIIALIPLRGVSYALGGAARAAETCSSMALAASSCLHRIAIDLLLVALHLA